MFDTKKCKHCYSDIDERASVCPVCHREQYEVKPSILSTFFRVFVITILIGLLIVCVFYLFFKEDINTLEKPQDVVELFKFGEFDCSNEEKDSEGYITGSYSWGKLNEVKEVLVTETHPDYRDMSFELMKGLFKDINKINGFNVSFKKIEANKIEATYLVNYRILDYDALEDYFNRLESTSSYNEANEYKKAKYWKNFKKNTLEDYICK